MRFAAPRSHISRAVSKPPAEIVRHEIHRSPNRGGVQELFDELRQAVERTLEAGRHFRMPEAGEIRRDAATMRRKALGDAFPHDAAVRIAVEEQTGGAAPHSIR